MLIINVCKHCSEHCSGDYCRLCKTQEQREKMDKENSEIKEENIKLGFN